MRRSSRSVPAFLEGLKIIDGVLGPGKDHAVIPIKGCAGQHIVHGCILFEQFEVREIRDPGEADNRNPHAAPARPLVAKREGIFAREREGEIRDNPQHRYAAQFLDLLYPGCKYRRIAAELVDDDAFDQRPDIFRQEGKSPVHLCKHPAPLDIGNKDDRNVQGLCKQGVGNIPVIEVQLGSTTGTFHHHLPVHGSEAVIGLQRFFQEIRVFPGNNP